MTVGNTLKFLTVQQMWDDLGCDLEDQLGRAKPQRQIRPGRGWEILGTSSLATSYSKRPLIRDLLSSALDLKIGIVVPRCSDDQLGAIYGTMVVVDRFGLHRRGGLRIQA